MSTADDHGQDHLTPEEVAAYLDRRLTPVQQATAETHLAGCPSCRGELVAVVRIRRGPARRRRWYVGAAAAAAVLIIALLGRQPSGTPLPGALRSGSEGVSHFATVAPTPKEAVAAAGLRFVWRSAGPAATYRLTLTDPSGAPVWTSSTPDTAVVLAEPVKLEGGRAYFWYVDALLPDGRSATTGVQQFRTSP